MSISLERGSIFNRSSVSYSFDSGAKINQGNWPCTAEGVIKRYLEGGVVRWVFVPPAELRGLLHRASEELIIPAAFFRSEEFYKSLNLLGGRTLRGLYKFAHNHPLRDRRETTSFLLDELDIHGTSDDVIVAMKYMSQIDWSRVPFSEIRLIIERASAELKKPANAFSHFDFLAHFDFLNGHSLRGLRDYALQHPENKGKSSSTFLLQRSGIADEMVIKIRTLGGSTFFEQASWEEIGDVLRRVAEEKGKPVSALTYKEIMACKPSFLGGKSTRGVIERIRKEHIAFQEMRELTGIEITAETIIAKAKAGKLIFWDEVPRVVLSDVLNIAAQELGKPVATLTVRDLLRDFQFLGGRTLGGLQVNMNRQKYSDTTSIASLLEKADIKITAEDVIDSIKNGRLIPWNRVGWGEIRRLIEMGAEELGILPEMIGSQELRQSYDFLGGGNLYGIHYFVIVNKNRDPSHSALSFLRENTGIEQGFRIIRTPRRRYRERKIKAIFQELFEKRSSLPTVEGLLPTIHSVARLYTNPFLGIETEEIESEAVVFALDFMVRKRTDLVFAAALHTHLERYIHTISSPRYREMLLSTPITEDGSKTLGDVISLKSNSGSSTSEISGVLGQKLNTLTPLQKELVLKIAVDERTMEEVGKEFGLDVDTVQEVYYETLSLLRDEMN